MGQEVYFTRDKKMNQLGLPISLNSSMLLENFVANKELSRSINQLFEGQISSELYIYGLSGNGKTHALQGAVLKSLENDKNAVFIAVSYTHLTLPTILLV